MPGVEDSEGKVALTDISTQAAKLEGGPDKGGTQIWQKATN